MAEKTIPKANWGKKRKMKAIEKGTKFKIIKGSEKGKLCSYLEAQNNSNWHIVNIEGGNDKYLVNLEELEKIES